MADPHRPVYLPIDYPVRNARVKDFPDRDKTFVKIVTYTPEGGMNPRATFFIEVRAMNQMNVVATAVLGAIVWSFCYMFNFFPLWIGLGVVGLTCYVAVAPSRFLQKKAPLNDPWYMKD